jgi:hypothetical protein
MLNINTPLATTILCNIYKGVKCASEIFEQKLNKSTYFMYYLFLKTISQSIIGSDITRGNLHTTMSTLKYVDYNFTSPEHRHVCPTDSQTIFHARRVPEVHHLCTNYRMPSYVIASTPNYERTLGWPQR